ncbi:imidazolonepropionase-like amidohydrolase [Chitinophaga skermanii]|uniref:Imidazolonepropionase-like amidohydrolase n=1 Tax=Chitinophaga skermanii TaxID=331697 RepID=A0A327R585_9BACT|nr:amidohydrolase family protein [Chitinophaga skermanii]RAJ11122.1 imidazolonepropionase-like amidohydrolase [Chitinophaga skermanii]
MKTRLLYSLVLLPFLHACSSAPQQLTNKTLLRNATVIDGTGKAPMTQTDILISGDQIEAIGQHLDSTGANVVDLNGKTVMPALISAHVHIGNLKDTTTTTGNYTRENILSQLKKYEDYGVLHVLVMGTDRPWLFKSGLKDSSATGLLPGARIHSAGFGFGASGGGSFNPAGASDLFHPADAAEAKTNIDTLAQYKPDMVKIWVDDFGGGSKKMEPAVYQAIIKNAHQHNLRVAAHLYYAADASALANDGLDVIAHSIRDTVITDELVQLLKQKGVCYIPTLSLDEFSFIYARKPEWVDDAFFKAALEPGVYEMITSEKYQNDIKNSPSYNRNMKGFEIALQNLKKLYDGGVIIALGTDSGATPVRVQGFSEHLELELMVKAGLLPIDAIKAATQNAAKVLKLDEQFGTIEKGKVADLLILDGNPVEDIKNTRKINAVYKAGKIVKP